MKRLTSDQIVAELSKVAGRPDAHERLPQETVRILKENMNHYNWVGIYYLEGEELVLGPFQGPPSPHTRITIDLGICGAAAREERTVIVNDVNSDPRFLACSLATRSEIVVPIFKNGQVVGEIDIDSDTPEAFSEPDRSFLERVARLLGRVY